MNLLHHNDTPGHYPPTWYRDSTPAHPAFAALDTDIQCDVCVIGGGFTGLSAALHLADTGCDVVLLEAHRVGWGASGRNGGQLGSGQRVSQESLETQFGDALAREFWQLAEDAKRCVLDLTARYRIDCDYQPGIVHAVHKTAYLEDLNQHVAKLRSQYDYKVVELLDRQQVAEILGTDCYHGGCIDLGAGHLNPLKLAIGLAKAADGAGVRIFENSEVVQTANARGQGHSLRVTTMHANVYADKLIYACNGYLGALEPTVADRVMPINNYIIATEVLPSALSEAILKGNVAAEDSRFVVNYFRKSEDGRLLFGGRESYGYRFPRDIRGFVRGAMLKVYPQLAATKIEYGWGGTLAITRSRMPYVRRLRQNTYSSSGYSGHGVGLANLCGRLIAEAIIGESRGFDAMASIPARRFPGGTVLQAPLLATAMLWYALRDRL